MAKKAGIAVIMCLLALLFSACSGNGIGVDSASSHTTVIIKPPSESQNNAGGDKTEKPRFPPEERVLSMEMGGQFLKLNDSFACLFDGKVFTGNEESGLSLLCEGVTAEKIYFDGTNVYYADKSGISAVYPGGGRQLLSTDNTRRMAVWDGRIYYIKQDSGAGDIQGELWSVDVGGGSPVLSLNAKVKKSFSVYNGWIYYISQDGGLYRNMLFGSVPTALAPNADEILCVTDSALYYREDADTGNIRRLDLKTAANISLGLYGQIRLIGDSVYVMSRRDRLGRVDNLFSLYAVNDLTAEQSFIVMFQNIGDDIFRYYQNGFAYLQRESSLYRVEAEDPLQEKQRLFPDDTVFIGGTAYYKHGNEITAVGCQSGESWVIKVE